MCNTSINWALQLTKCCSFLTRHCNSENKTNGFLDCRVWDTPSYPRREELLNITSLAPKKNRLWRATGWFETTDFPLHPSVIVERRRSCDMCSKSFSRWDNKKTMHKIWNRRTSNQKKGRIGCWIWSREWWKRDRGQQRQKRPWRRDVRSLPKHSWQHIRKVSVLIWKQS